MQVIIQIGQVVSGISAIITMLVLLIKPIRKRLFNNHLTVEGEKCLLRIDMLHTYYNNLEAKKIRQYEYESFIKLYEAYKALGGNSFIDKIYSEVKEWEIVS